MDGHIYFIVNPSMPGLVKVGCTSGSVEDRMSQLNGTGVPTPFNVIAQFYVREVQSVESEIHKLLSKHRLTSQREFFTGDPKQLLDKCISILFENLASNASQGNESLPSKKEEVSELGKKILLYMSGGQYRDMARHHLEDLESPRVNWLIMERHLEDLRQLGFVEFRRARGSNDWDTWRVTSKGIKYLFDTDLLNEEELESSWFTWA